MHSHVPAGIVPYEELVYTSENFSFEVNILTGSNTDSLCSCWTWLRTTWSPRAMSTAGWMAAPKLRSALDLCVPSTRILPSLSSSSQKSEHLQQESLHPNVIDGEFFQCGGRAVQLLSLMVGGDGANISTFPSQDYVTVTSFRIMVSDLVLGIIDGLLSSLQMWRRGAERNWSEPCNHI